MTDQANSAGGSPTAAVGAVRTRLWVMMFLHYSVYGIWLPIASRFLSAPVESGGLGFSNGQIGAIIAVAGAIGAIFAPFFVGQIADRYFSAERCLAVLMIVGGIIKWYTAYQTTFAAWLGLSIIYSVLFMPTLSLTNAIAMMNLPDPKRQFASVRAFGTIGWIAAGWLFSMIWLLTDVQFRALPPFFEGNAVENGPARMIDSLKVSGFIAIFYGIGCWFLLPHTPPRKGATQKLAFARAFGIVKTHRSFAVFLVAALLISSVHQIYFIQTAKFLGSIGLADEYMLPAMSIGQFAEIGAMALLGLILTRIGFRNVLILGATCYMLRYLVFGTSGLPLGVIIASQVLHGFCFSCFYAAGFIYVDRIAPPDARNSAQTVVMLVMFGFGPLCAGWLNGFLAGKFSADGVLNYSNFWYTLAAIALVAVIGLVIAFRDESEDTKPSETNA